MSLPISCIRLIASFSLMLMLFALFTIPPTMAGKKYHKNKYSTEVNRESDEFTVQLAAIDRRNIERKELQPTPPGKYDLDFQRLHKPFRMAKLNMVWTKAKQRLTEPKLKSLFTDLKIHDKEELAWKQLNGQHMDKDGLKEAALRQKLVGIMSTYDILDHFDDTLDTAKYNHHQSYVGKVPTNDEVVYQHKQNSYMNRSVFKDKKLNKLWEKAEVSGFTADELAALREEFVHHQDKVDMYYAILEESVGRRKDERHENAVNEDEFDHINQIQLAEEPFAGEAGRKHNAYLDEANLLRVKHRDLRDNIDRLERIAAKGPNSEDFVEPKVQNLWRVASTSNFSVDELASLRVELLHFESRLLKLRHLHAEQALNREISKDAVHQSKQDKYASIDQHIKKQLRKVEKMQTLLEERIFLHSEL